MMQHSNKSFPVIVPAGIARSRAAPGRRRGVLYRRYVPEILAILTYIALFHLV